MKHRIRFLDGGVVLASTVFVLYVGVTVDIFANAPGHTPAAESLELDELLGAVVVLSLGVLWAFRRLVRERRETHHRATVEREMRILAFHDPLTNLPNRRQFEDALKTAVACPPRADGNHALALLDLNGFKKVNDVFGHGAGDELLTHIAARLSRLSRDGDIVARLGGDEFAILATHLPSAEAATNLGIRIIEALTEPIVTMYGEHRIGAAIGLVLTPQDGTTPAELLRRADVALYRAKEQADSAMRFFEPEMDERVKERDRLERDLREAIERGIIVNVYQPLVDLRNGSVRAFEALGRWTHPDLGTIPPDRFLAIAENAGVIGLLTDQLFRLACQDAMTWGSSVTLTFNVAPLLLHDVDFPERVMRTLSSTGLAPQRLQLDVTESALVRDLEAAQIVLGKLHKAGVRIALDDFGTGYSNLYHLRNFRLDAIKIDRSFVAAMVNDAESDSIVRALVGLGAGLGLEVVAEGIESEEQKLRLIGHGCHQAQGFFCGPPLSLEEAMDLLQSKLDSNKQESKLFVVPDQVRTTTESPAAMIASMEGIA